LPDDLRQTINQLRELTLLLHDLIERHYRVPTARPAARIGWTMFE
jgi:hypothetical protein